MNDHQDKNVMKTKLILTAALLIAVFSGCKKEKDLAVPFVVSNTAETVYITAARLEATFSYPGTKYVIRVDVSERQDMSEAVHYDVKVNGDRLTAEVTGLKGITTYYYRYINDTGFGTAGSGVKSFTTNDYSVPAVTTAEVSEITGSSAKCGGDVTDDGCLEVTARGVCWGATQTPTVSDSHTSDGTGTGVFTSATTNLEPDTKYYIRAYATNAKGTGYGEVREFRTIENVVEPTVSTVEVKDVTALSAVAVGNVSSDGGAEIMSRGFCWSLSEAPTVDDHYVECEGATGSYEGLLAELEADETYHVRAFATNSAGTSYGEELTFTTSDGLPVVVTSSVTDITSTSAKCGGNVTDEGASSVTERGICWSTSQNPTVSNSHTTDGTGTGTFTSSMTGLTANTTYYVRAYATNSAGTSYGNELSFTTQEDTGNYFCITALDAGTTTVSMAKEGNAPTVHLEYKKNNGAWTAFTVGSTNISLSQNDKVFFKAPDGQPNNTFANSLGDYYNHFVIGGGNVDVSGNIMYLLDPTGNKITLASANNYTFSNLFNGCNKLVSANQLSLPATTLADWCYYSMFKGCSNLHYIRMLATGNLNATGTLYEWVSGVPSTGDFYKKAGANLPSGINGIPYGWTVHNE